LLTQRTIEPALTVITAGLNAIFWMVTVLPETKGEVGGYVIVAVGAAVKTMTVGVTVVVDAGIATGAGVGAGVDGDGNEGKIWLHPLASRSATAAMPRMTMYFITKFSSQIIRRSGAIKLIRVGKTASMIPLLPVIHLLQGMALLPAGS
jgi:hypothetical protein